MKIENVVQNLKEIHCKKAALKNEIMDALKDYNEKDITLAENGHGFFFDERIDIDYQVYFNPEHEPSIKLKVEKDNKDNIRVLDAWV